ncbi:MAG: Ig-like domain-containing protein, partial [Bacteroidota bacterium]
MFQKVLFAFLLVNCLMVYQTVSGQSPVINEVSIDPDLNITYFDAYTGKVEVFVPEDVTLTTLTFTVTPVSFDGTDVTVIDWNYNVDGTPADNDPTTITISANDLAGPVTQTFDFEPIRPDNIYPEIQFAPSSVVYNNTPENSQIDRDRLHLMKFENPLEVVDNTAFFIEVYAEPVAENPPRPIDLEVYLVGKGKDLTFFDGNWQDDNDVALVRAINWEDPFDHTHSLNSAHHLTPLTASGDPATIKVGTKEIDVNDDFWIVLSVDAQQANRSWNLKYHTGAETGFWHVKDGNNTAVAQSGYPDMHVHLARDEEGVLVDGVDLDLVAQYEVGGSINTLTDEDNYYYFSELPNLPPNASSFTEPEPGTYSETVTIAWNAASDPNNDPLSYNVFLAGSTATETLATGLTSTTYELNTLDYPNGDYDIIVEACDAEFCTSFAWSSGIDADEGEDDFFRIMNPPPPPIANDDEFCINAATDLDVLANDEFDEYYETVGSITVTITEQPVAGAATVNPNGTIAFDPTGGTQMSENQVVTFTYRVFDPDFPDVFDEAEVTVRYLSINNPPDANDVSATTTTELPVVIDVLSNDTDPQGSELFVDAIVSGPIAGSAVINPDQTITYTPFTGFEGTDSFVYQVCNESCGDLDPACATATVTVTVIFAYYVCADGSSTISVDEVPGATGYVWTLPEGAVPLGTVTVTQTTPNVIAVTNGNQIEVDWSGVAPGQYEVCVEPENDCGPGTEQCIQLVVSDIELTAEAFDVACFGENNGFIDLTIDGGIPPYSFDWTKEGDPEYSANVQSPGGLSTGTYNVTVTDANGCIGTTSATITEPDEDLIVTGVVTDEDPSGAANGAIELTVSGGTGSYTFQWTKEDDPEFSETTQNISGLTGGVYRVVVTDDNGCEEELFFTVDQIGGPLELFAEPTHVLCFGEASGAIDLFVVGGITPYSYSWVASNGGVVPTGQETNQNLTDLVAGTYTVTVTDSDDPAVSETLAIIITEPDTELTASATGTDVTCFGENNGEMTLNVNGGTEPYTYQWNTGAVTQDLIDLGPGTYTVTVTDDNGCTTTASATIEEPTEIVIVGVVSNASCSPPNNGDIDLTSVDGGTEPYSYSWTGPNDFTSTDRDISNLEPGTYIVNVTDANGCSEQESFTIRNACIEVTKALLSGPTNNGDGTYDLTYQVAVQNTGNTNLESVQVVEDLAATYTTFSGVSISSTKFTVNATYTGKTPETDLLAAGETLTPGEEGLINISFTVSDVTVTPATTYTNTVTATAQDADGVETTDTDDNGVTFNEDPIIGVAKALTTGPTINPDGSYDLSFTITVRNYGDVPLENVQVTDDLDATFGAGTYAVNDVTASSGFTENNDFNGSANQNLLSASTSMAINEIRTIVISLNVTPTTDGPFANQATGTATGPGGTETEDLSQDGTNPDPDNDGDPTNNDDPTPIVFPENPEIGIAKRLVGDPVNNNDGTYSLTYEFRVKNTGDVILYDVQIQDDLTATFPAKTVVVNDISSTALTPSFPGYDGDTDINLLDGSDQLVVDETKIVTLELTVTPGDNLGPYNNTAEASGTSAFGSTVTDTSHDGTSVDPDNTGPGNHGDPTPVTFSEDPVIGLAKAVSDITNNQDGTYDVTYTIYVQNYGDVPLGNVQVTDDLDATFTGAEDYTVQSISASGALNPNTVADFNTTNNLLVAASSSVAYNDAETITLVVQVTPGTNLGVYENFARPFGCAGGEVLV